MASILDPALVAEVTRRIDINLANKLPGRDETPEQAYPGMFGEADRHGPEIKRAYFSDMMSLLCTNYLTSILYRSTPPKNLTRIKNFAITNIDFKREDAIPPTFQAFRDTAVEIVLRALEYIVSKPGQNADLFSETLPNAHLTFDLVIPPPARSKSRKFPKTLSVAQSHLMPGTKH